MGWFNRKNRGSKRRTIYRKNKGFYRNNCLGYFRHPRTMNESKRSLDRYDPEYTEYKIKFRGRRNEHTLPNAWDDVMCSIHDQFKGWKSNSKRRHQWIPLDIEGKKELPLYNPTVNWARSYEEWVEEKLNQNNDYEEYDQ